MQHSNLYTNSNSQLSGLFSLTLRLVVGWTYFSAFWRRLFLADKLNPEAAGYIGEKFNHFLPHALGIKPMIEYLVTHPDSLWWAMTIFTVVEGIVGLLLIFGFFSRLMSIGVFSLALGILLGSGWIGTTCLDEWQIGILGIASGFTLFFMGSGAYSIDQYLIAKNYSWTKTKAFKLLASGDFPLSYPRLKKAFFIGSLLILFISLFTNQVFHGGVWGKLHNKSVKPKIELSQATYQRNQISFDLFRVEGVDVYGSFLIELKVIDKESQVVYKLDGDALAQFPPHQIDNYYVTKVKPGAHSLVIPLGAKATLTLTDKQLRSLKKGEYTVLLTDISGAEWRTKLKVES